MSNPFFDHPILNSPYGCPARHWELDKQGQPTQQIIEKRRRAEFITPIPKPKKRKAAAVADQEQIIFDEGKGLSSAKQQYDPTAKGQPRVHDGPRADPASPHGTPEGRWPHRHLRGSQGRGPNMAPVFQGDRPRLLVPPLLPGFGGHPPWSGWGERPEGLPSCGTRV